MEMRTWRSVDYLAADHGHDGDRFGQIVGRYCKDVLGQHGQVSELPHSQAPFILFREFRIGRRQRVCDDRLRQAERSPIVD
jgi:hypothetical protein